LIGESNQGYYVEARRPVVHRVEEGRVRKALPPYPAGGLVPLSAPVGLCGRVRPKVPALTPGLYPACFLASQKTTATRPKPPSPFPTPPQPHHPYRSTGIPLTARQR
jgi:hypothetical protein